VPLEPPGFPSVDPAGIWTSGRGKGRHKAKKAGEEEN
jgi:hypothetical protein